MRLPHFAFATLFAAASAHAQVVINEIRVDQAGTDTDEYIELYGTPGASLDGLTYLVIGDGTGGSGVIETVASLDGYSLNGSGFFAGGETMANFPGTGTVILAGANVLNFENGDNVTHLLVSGFTGANGDDLDTDDNGVLDVTPWTSVLDAVSVLQTVGTGDLYYATTLGGSDVGPNGTFAPGHVYRLPDGGAWMIGPFDAYTGVDTPNRANFVEVPEISITQVGGNVEISCQSASGYTYQLVVSPADLSSWTDLIGQSQAGTGGVITFTLLAPASPAKVFYKVRYY